MVPAGTQEEKLANLAAQLNSNGISTTSGSHPGDGRPLLHVSSTVLSDYADAFGTDSLLLYGDPLEVTDGNSNDAE